MQVSVHYVAQVRRAAGCASESVQLDPDATLRGLFDRLAGRHGTAFDALLLDRQGAPHPALLLFVGDQPADLAKILHDGDTVTILTPMAGG